MPITHAPALAAVARALAPPDCPACDANNTLSPVWTEPPVTVYECSCCSAVVRVTDGRAVLEPRRRDVSGRGMPDP